MSEQVKLERLGDTFRYRYVVCKDYLMECLVQVRIERLGNAFGYRCDRFVVCRQLITSPSKGKYRGLSVIRLMSRCQVGKGKDKRSLMSQIHHYD